MSELIFSSDTINEGRIKLNDSYSAEAVFNLVTATTITSGEISGNTVSGTTLFSGSTDVSDLLFSSSKWVSGAGTNSLIAKDRGTATATGNYSINGSNNGQSIGNYSTVVGGNNNIAEQTYSFIGGGRNHLISGSSSYSVIVGGNTNKISGTSMNNCFIGSGGGNRIADGSANSAIISGSGNVIDGDSDTSFIGTTVTGTITNTSDHSAIVAGRYSSLYSSQVSFVGAGQSNTLTGSNYSAIVSGLNNYSSGSHSFVGGGESNKTNGSHSSVLGGKGNEAAHARSIAGGGGSKTTADDEIAWAGTNTTTPSTANNTFRFDLTAGDIYLDGSNNAGPADYAEYFEWKDGNENNEDRKGLFVSLDGDKIEINNSNVIGVVSIKPVIVGDAAPNKWSGVYIKDEWGEPKEEIYSVYKVSITPKKGNLINEIIVYKNENGTYFTEYPNPSNIDGIEYYGKLDCKEKINEIKKPKVNPSYDSDVEYIPRKDRKEWSPIGLLGKLYVKSAEEITSTKIDVNENGMAINGTTYHVLKTIKPYSSPYGIIQVLIK